MTVMVVAVTVVVVVTAARRRRPGSDATEWPWMLGVVESVVDDGHATPADAVLGVLLHGPPAASLAVRDALRDLGPDRRGPAGADHGRVGAPALAAVRDRLGSVRGDRLCGTVAAIERSGEPPDVALARLRTLETAAQPGVDTAHRHVAAGRAGRWLLLTPLLAVGSGALDGGAAWLAAATAVALWWLADMWLSTGDQPRVFAHEPLDPGS